MLYYSSTLSGFRRILTNYKIISMTFFVNLGVSSVSSNSGGNVSNNGCSTKLCGGAKCGGACLGAVPRVPTASAPPRPRQPASNSLRRSQHHSMKVYMYIFYSIAH